LKGRWSHFGIELLIAGLFGWIAWSQGRRCWRETEYLRVAPLTEITRAFDFGDHHTGAFEADRFTCTIRNVDFAHEFAALNRARAWSQNSPRAENDRRQSNRKIWMFGALMLVIALATHLLGWVE
jgi:hypothetical protein